MACWAGDGALKYGRRYIIVGKGKPEEVVKNCSLS
jgi:hypothetical protein